MPLIKAFLTLLLHCSESSCKQHSFSKAGCYLTKQVWVIYLAGLNEVKETETRARQLYKIDQKEKKKRQRLKLQTSLIKSFITNINSLCALSFISATLLVEPKHTLGVEGVHAVSTPIVQQFQK